MAHPNEDLLRTGYAAFMEQDISTVFGIIDPAIVWRSGDHNALTGTFHGHDEVAAFFIKLLEVTGGTFKLTLQRIIADDSGAAVMVDATGERDGQFYAWQQAHVWEMRDGKATSLTLYSNDGRTVDRVFAGPHLTHASARSTSFRPAPLGQHRSDVTDSCSSPIRR